jgi:hypothetical protein
MTKELNLMLANYRLKWVNLVLEKGLSRREVPRLSDRSARCAMHVWVSISSERSCTGWCTNYWMSFQAMSARKINSPILTQILSTGEKA